MKFSLSVLECPEVRKVCREVHELPPGSGWGWVRLATRDQVSPPIHPRKQSSVLLLFPFIILLYCPIHPSIILRPAVPPQGIRLLDPVASQGGRDMITLLCDLTIVKDTVHRKIGVLETADSTSGWEGSSSQAPPPSAAAATTASGPQMDWPPDTAAGDRPALTFSEEGLFVPRAVQPSARTEDVELLDLLTPTPHQQQRLHPHEDFETMDHQHQSSSNPSLRGSVSSTSLPDSEAPLPEPLDIPQSERPPSVIETTDRQQQQQQQSTRPSEPQPTRAGSPSVKKTLSSSNDPTTTMTTTTQTEGEGPGSSHTSP